MMASLVQSVPIRFARPLWQQHEMPRPRNTRLWINMVSRRVSSKYDNTAKFCIVSSNAICYIAEYLYHHGLFISCCMQW